MIFFTYTNVISCFAYPCVALACPLYVSLVDAVLMNTVFNCYDVYNPDFSV